MGHSLYIFDLGNVIIDQVDIIPAVCERLDTDPEVFVTYYQARLDHLMTGTLSVQEFWSGYEIVSGTFVTEDLLHTCFHPVGNHQMVQLLGDLRAAGHRVVCGTNTCESHYSHIIESGMTGWFDAVYASHLMGSAKPDRRFFEYILEREGAAAHEVFFTDDLPEHVSAAQALGIDAVRFEGYGSVAGLLPRV
jgi:glucose-1-phosphatase